MLRLAFLLLAFFTCFCPNIQAQQKVIDSVYKIPFPKHDTAVIYRFLALSEAHLYVNPDSTRVFAVKAIEKSRRTGFKRGEGIALINIGMMYADKSEYDSAFANFNRAAAVLPANDRKYRSNIFNETGKIYFSRGELKKAKLEFERSLSIKLAEKDSLGAAAAYNNLGVVCRNMSEYDCALDNYFRALRIREKKGDTKGIAQSYTNLAIIYGNLNQHEKSLEYDFKSLRLKETLKDQMGIAKSYNNIASTYSAVHRYDSAIIYNNKAIAIRESISDKTGLASSYYNLGGIYVHLKEYSKGIGYLLKSLKIYEQLQEQSGQSLCYMALGSAGREMKKFKEAEKYFSTALEIVQSTGTTDQLKDIYTELALLNEGAGNYREAYRWQKKLMDYKDSVLNEGNNEKLAELEKIYQTEKKELQIENLNKEKEKDRAVAAADSRKKNIIITSVSAGLLLVIVFAFFIFRALRITSRQKRIIEKQKGDAVKARITIEEKQKEILDSIRYAKRIQTALLTSEKYIGRKLNALKEK